MESETGTLSHTDFVSRYCPQQQRAGRVAGAVNDDLLVRIAELGESFKIFINPAPRIVPNPNRCPGEVDAQRADAHQNKQRAD